MKQRSLSLAVAFVAIFSISSFSYAQVGGAGGDGGAFGLGGGGASGQGGSAGVGGGTSGSGGDVGLTVTTGTTLPGSITGGAGGAGGADAGGGGGGGVGVYVSATGVEIVNSGAITGGNGGNGSVNVTVGAGGGGGGGNGVSGSGFTITNNGTITGGDGGDGGSGAYIIAGGGGGGGNGIAGASLAIVNSGTISGGAGGSAGVDDGNSGGDGRAGTAGDAILFSGGTNTLTLDTGSVLNGAVETMAGATTTITISGTGINLSGGTLGSGTSDVITALIVNGTTTVNNGSYTATISGIISGSSTFISTGNGTLTLSGSNSYSGGTVVSEGELDAENADALGTGLATVDGSATLVVSGSSGGTFTNDVNNQGTVNFENVTLGSSTSQIINNGVNDNGTNAYGIYNSGTLPVSGNMISGGTMTFDNSNAGSATINNGVTLSGEASGIGFENGYYSIGGTNTVSGNTISGGEVSFSGSSSAGSATINNSVTLSGAYSGIGVDNGFGSYEATNTVSGNTISGGEVSFSGSSSAGSATINNSITLSGSYSGIGFENGFGSSGGTNTVSGNTISGGEVSFSGSSSAGSATIINGVTISGEDAGIDGIAELSDANGNQIIGGVVTFSGNATGTGATIQNGWGGVVDVSGITTGSIAIGEVSGSGNIYLGANNLTLGGLNTNDTISGVISDGSWSGAWSTSGTGVTGGSLTKTGTGTLTLSGSNSYSGGTMISEGELDVTNSYGLGTGTATNYATLSFSNGVTINNTINNAGSNANTIFNDTSSAGSSTITNSGSSSYALFRDNSTADSAMIINSGTNSYAWFYDTSSAGNATITNSGYVSDVGFSGSAGAGSATITNSGTYSYAWFYDNTTAATATITNSGIGSGVGFSGSASAGSATITNSGTDSYVEFDDSSTADNAVIVNNAVNSGSGNENGIDISGHTGSLAIGEISGSGNIYLGANNLTLGGLGTSDTISGVISDGGWNGGTGGSLTWSGTGTLTLSGSNSYSGGTVISGGELDVINSYGLGTGTATNYATLSFSNGVTINNMINNSGTGSSIFFNDSSTAGTASITNSGNNSYAEFTGSASAAGATIVNSGYKANVDFEGNATAGSATITNSGTFGAAYFYDNTSAGSAAITNSGVASGVDFSGYASAGNATITNSGTDSFAEFDGDATADNATIINNAVSSGSGNENGIDISEHNGSIAIGEVSGSGNIYLGANNLTLGGLNTDDTISGVIQDGGWDGGTGGSLTKIGTGTLILDGANSYTGDTTVSEGTLLVNGNQSAATGLTAIDNGALLGGAGAIGGDVTNHGTITGGSVGNPGTLAISGDFTNGSDGTLLVQVASTSDFSRLVVSGTSITLGGTLDVALVGGYKPNALQQFVILTDTTAGATLSGTFATINSAVTKFNVVYNPDPSIILEVIGFGQVSGLTPNQKNVGNALDKADNGSAGNNGDFTEVVNALGNLNTNQLRSALDAISPIGLASMTELAVSEDSQVYGNLTGRFDDIRDGVGSFSAGVSKVPVAMSKDDDKKNVEPTVEQEQFNRWSAWVSGIGGFADVNTSSNGSGNQPGYSFDTAGAMIGGDYRLKENLVVGIAGTYANGSSFVADGSRIDLNGGKLGAYGTWWQEGKQGAYVQGYAGGGVNSFDTQRQIAISGLGQRTARGDADSGEFNALLGTGYDWTRGNFRFGPTAALQYDYIGISGFNESGAGALDLGIHDQSANSLQSLIGARASYVWQINATQSLVPYVSAKWEHEYLDGARGISADLEGEDFSVETGAPGRDGALIDAGVTMNWNARISTSLTYQGELGRTNYSSNSIFGGVRVRF